MRGCLSVAGFLEKLDGFQFNFVKVDYEPTKGLLDFYGDLAFSCNSCQFSFRVAMRDDEAKF